MEAEHGPGEPDHFPNAFSDVVLGFHVVRRAGEYRWFSKKAMMAADVEDTWTWSSRVVFLSSLQHLPSEPAPTLLGSLKAPLR